MIKISSNLIKSAFARTNLLSFSNNHHFAKQAKPAKDAKKGAKQQKKQQQAPTLQQTSQKLLPHQKLVNYFTPLQRGLSVSQKQTLNNKFSDIDDQQKQMLEKLADRIANLNTSMFYDFVYKREGLGTTQGFIVGSGQWQDNQVKQAIKILRKDV